MTPRVIDVLRRELLGGTGYGYDFVPAIASAGTAAGGLADALQFRIEAHTPYGYPYGLVVPLLAVSGDGARQRLSRLLSVERTAQYVLNAHGDITPWLADARDAAAGLLREPNTSTPFATLFHVVAKHGNTADGVEAILALVEGRCEHFDPAMRAGALLALRTATSLLGPHIGRLLAIHAGEPPPSGVRDAALTALAPLASESPAVMDLLRRELARAAKRRLTADDRPAWSDRQAVVDAPTAAGIAAAALMPEVRDMARHPEAGVRMAATRALAAMRTAEATAELRRLAAEPDDGVRGHALEAVARAGVADADTLRFLADAITAGSGEGRIPYMEAARGLKTPTPELLAALESARGDADRRTAVEAGRVLVALGGRKARGKKRGTT